jgi:hypothetical protein
LKLTGFNARQQGLLGAGTWWHFGSNEALLKKYEPHAHIPIRYPLHVAKSWAQRGKTGDVIGGMLNRYRCMFEYLKDHDATFYRMEGLPRLEGTDEHQDAPEESRRIAVFQDAVREHVIEPHRAFFAQFYKDIA